MFQHQGIWLPDGEQHFPEWMSKNGEIVDGKGTYQIKKFRAAMEHCKNFRIALDVGGHVGLWAMHLAKRFEWLDVYEPVEMFRECFKLNMNGIVNWSLRPIALGHPPKPGGWTGPRRHVKMNTPRLGVGIDSGGTHVSMEEPDEFDLETAELWALDEFDFAIVDFIKIDCEGFEQEVIAGALETIRRCKPCIIVEQKPHKLGANFGIKGTPAVDLLVGEGYSVAREIGGDYIMVRA